MRGWGCDGLSWVEKVEEDCTGAGGGGLRLASGVGRTAWRKDLGERRLAKKQNLRRWPSIGSVWPARNLLGSLMLRGGLGTCGIPCGGHP